MRFHLAPLTLTLSDFDFFLWKYVIYMLASIGGAAAVQPFSGKHISVEKSFLLGVKTFLCGGKHISAEKSFLL